jgi:hypothetical protein
MKITLSEGQHVQIGSTLVSIHRARGGRTTLDIDTEDCVRRDKLIERELAERGWDRIGLDLWQYGNAIQSTHGALMEAGLL